MAKVLVPWSGGVDSTAVFIKALEEGHEVWTVFLNWGSHPIQNKRELDARKDILSVIESRLRSNPNLGTYNGDIVCNAKINIHSPSLEYSQIPSVFFLLISVIGEYDFDEIHFGFIFGDRSAPLWEEAVELWKPLCRLAFSKKLRIPEIKAPFLWTTKEELRTFLSRPPWRVDRLIWQCTMPVRGKNESDGKYSPCGECFSCKRHISKYSVTCI